MLSDDSELNIQREPISLITFLAFLEHITDKVDEIEEMRHYLKAVYLQSEICR